MDDASVAEDFDSGVRALPDSVPSAYLAGPEVFLRNAVDVGKRLKSVCASKGVRGLFPLDAVLSHPDPVALAAMIARANEDLIRRCDFVIANMTPFRGPSMDVGTAYEIGFARALRKPVFGYFPNATSYMERVANCIPLTRIESEGVWRDTSGWAVEDFGGLTENLMLACGITGLSSSFEEALDRAVAWIHSI